LLTCLLGRGARGRLFKHPREGWLAALPDCALRRKGAVRVRNAPTSKFFRQFNGAAPAEYYSFLNGDIPEPDWKLLFPMEWERACLETVKLELGSPQATREIDARLEQITKSYGANVILIGGPPCQAYSLVGRARNRGTEGYEASKDHRHFLYKEYIRILQKLMPAAFVMENVKGLLSSSIDGERIFDQVLDDLSRVGKGSYRLVPLAPRSGQSFFDQAVHPPAFDFVVRTEDHGIPQSRHRVIIVGIRADIAAGLEDSQISASLLPQSRSRVNVRDVLKGKGGGSVRRFARVLRQLDLTFDPELMPPGGLSAVLPVEFDTWKKSVAKPSLSSATSTRPPLRHSDYSDWKDNAA
jgi:C-5 cytosine-specific DNA methylase